MQFIDFFFQRSTSSLLFLLRKVEEQKVRSGNEPSLNVNFQSFSPDQMNENENEESKTNVKDTIEEESISQITHSHGSSYSWNNT